MREWNFCPNHLVRASLVLFGAVLLAGCAQMQLNGSGAREASDGVVIGTLTTNGKAEEFTHVYARAAPSKAENAGEDTRVILVTEALSNDALSQIVEDRWNGSADTKGVVMDIGTDSKWSARFITPLGLQDTYGFTSMGGDAKVENGRAHGRIALSNQSDGGIRAFKVSFDAPMAIAAGGDTTARVATLIGRWRIDDWTGTKGQKYAGDIEFARRDARLVATARIQSGVDHLVVEEFDVRIEGEVVRLYGIVDPDARWTADELTLRLEGDALVGEYTDDNKNEGPVRFRRIH